LYGAGTANNYLGGKLGIGTTSPQDQLHLGNTLTNVNSVIRLSCHVNSANIVTFRNADDSVQGGIVVNGSSYAYGTYGQNQVNITGGSGGIGLRVLNTSGSSLVVYGGNASADFATKYLQVFGNTGNVLIQNGGTFTDAGFLLDVNGTARVSGLITGNANARLTGLYPYLELKPDGWSSSLYIQSGLNAALSGVGDYTAFQNPTGKGYLFTSGSTNAIHINPTNANVALNGTADSGYRLYINRGGSATGALAVVGGITDFAASTTSYASLQINAGVDPTSPVNGNIWFDGTDLKMRIGGVTKTFTLI
jgi:hypothetical protein